MLTWALLLVVTYPFYRDSEAMPSLDKVYYKLYEMWWMNWYDSTIYILLSWLHLAL